MGNFRGFGLKILFNSLVKNLLAFVKLFINWFYLLENTPNQNILKLDKLSKELDL
jgi:hypothetical protein